MSSGDIASSLMKCLLSLSFFLSLHHLTFVIINLLFVHVIFKGGKVKVEYVQLFPIDDKEDEDLQLEGQGGGRSNQTKTKVHAMFLKLCTTMLYMTAFVVARGILHIWRCPPQEVSLLHQLLGTCGVLSLPLEFCIMHFPNQEGIHSCPHYW